MPAKVGRSAAPPPGATPLAEATPRARPRAANTSAVDARETRRAPRTTPSALSPLVAGLAPPSSRVVGAADVVAHLERAGFTCTPASHGATRCRGRVSGHPLPVNVFVPREFRADAPQDVAVHLHGHLLGSPVERTVFQRFDFAAMGARAGFEGLTLVPESADRDATFNAWGRGSSSFSEMVRGVLTASGVSPNVRSIALSGHSGAYVAMAKVLNTHEPYADKISAVGLFDATYGKQDTLTSGARTVLRRDGLVFGANIAGSPTAAVSNGLAEALSGHAPSAVPYNAQSPTLATHGATFMSEKPGGTEQHWNLFARRYATFLDAFARQH